MSKTSEYPEVEEQTAQEAKETPAAQKKQQKKEKKSRRGKSGAAKTGRPASLRGQLVRTVYLILSLSVVMTVIAGIFSGAYAIKKNVRSDMEAMSQVAAAALSAEVENVKNNAESMALVYDAAQVDGQMSGFIQVKSALADYGFRNSALIIGTGVLKSSEFISDSELMALDCVSQAMQTGSTVLSTTQTLKDGETWFFAAAPTQTGCIVLTLDGQSSRWARPIRLMPTPPRYTAAWPPERPAWTNTATTAPPASVRSARCPDRTAGPWAPALPPTR